MVGVIGGIGAGKSVVAAAMGRRGAAVIDADRVGHEVLARPDVAADLSRWWGPRVVRPDGSVDRRSVAGIVFTDPAERRRLEGLVFPLIGRRVEAMIADADADPAVRFVALDAAVLLEAGWGHVCERVVYVDAPTEARLARLAARNGWSPAEVAAREAAQMPATERAARADVVLTNDGPSDGLQDRVDHLLSGWGLLPKDDVS